ncbi:MAG TPA: ATP--guanido phosphotransferase [Clostridiaceae bacterium]|nr:ATP--guanido phosphotransferase [Clostridiaceae bacterium]
MTWYLEEGPEHDVVISTRVRLARNLGDTSFPWRLLPEELERVRDRVTDAFCDIVRNTYGQKSVVVELDALGDIESRALAEKRIISHDMLKDTRGKSLLLYPGESSGILVNEEDHLRFYTIGAGLCLAETADCVIQCAAEMEKRLSFAKSERLGYLTVCPTNTGTGMRASAMLHVPGLIRAGIIKPLEAKLTKAGYALRGAEGEGSEAYGDIIQLSNQVTLGVSEEQILSDLDQLIHEVAHEERKARRILYENDMLALEDEIGRAKGNLLFSRLMTTDEAMRLLSLVRLGRELELPNMPSYAVLQELFVCVGEGVIQQAVGKPLDPRSRDEERARLIRKALQSSV